MTPTSRTTLSAFVLLSTSILAQQLPPVDMDSVSLGITARSPESNFVFYKSVTEVNLTLTVTNRKGHVVQGLGGSDFMIFDNDTQQTDLTFFQGQSSLPLRVALVLDTSASMTGQFETEQEAVGGFLKQVIRREDRVTLFAFSDSIRAVIPINYNWHQVARRVRRLKPDGQTALFDAVCAAARSLADDTSSVRRIIIVVSDGEENQSAATLPSAIASVLASGAVIYTVNAGNDFTSDLAKQGEAVLRNLSDATGGNYFKAAPTGDVGPAFGNIRKELRSQYSIAYKPLHFSAQQFHRVKVLVPNLIVHCRAGYYPR